MNIEVLMGELVVTENKDVNLIADAIGSCVVVTLYDYRLKIAGMAHAMLPASDTIHKPRTTNHELPSTKYLDIAIDSVLKKMLALGSHKSDIGAKLTGGANIFHFTDTDLGMDNVLSAKKKLKQEGIKVIGESTGGFHGSSVSLSVATGIVTVTICF